MTPTQIWPSVTDMRRLATVLAPKAHSSYVPSADDQFFRLCRIHPSGAAPELSSFENSSVFPLSPPGQRGARQKGQAVSNFDYAGPFTEVVLLGNVALRFPGTRLMWDGPNMKVTNVLEANQYVGHNYRTGWTLP